MPNLPITFACGLYDRMLPLYTGEVAVEGVDLKFVVEDNPRVIFDRMAAEQAYDVCEFSSSEFISRFTGGQCPFVAIPVFAYANVGLAINNEVPSGLLSYGLGLGLLAGVAHLVVRKFEGLRDNSSTVDRIIDEAEDETHTTALSLNVTAALNV